MLTVSRLMGMSIAVSCFLNVGPAVARTSDELKALQEEVQAVKEGQVQFQKDPDDPSKVHLTKFVRGAQSLAVFSAAIDELIKTAALAE